MIKEIGSEFWLCEQCENEGMSFNDDIVFLLSGRTALDYVIRDIKLNNEFKSVYLPSYCCHTMIEPFIGNNIEVEFYDVLYDEKTGFDYKIDYTKNIDCILILQYFGFYNSKVEQIIEKFKNLNKLVIEDVTHSIFQDKPYSKLSDYIIGSLRKWSCLYSGGFALKLNSRFNMPKPKAVNLSYIDLRKKAVELKFEYMSNQIENKNEFLKCFNDAERLLELDYVNYSIDEISYSNLKHLNSNFIGEKRKTNASMLLNGLTNINFIKPIYMQISEKDVPLFLPVLIENNLRDKFKNFLIENKIYCPTHWPISDLHSISCQAKKIYDNELSLVCDQRYGGEELKFMIETIKNFKVQGM